jgi:hypothetical protein
MLKGRRYGGTSAFEVESWLSEGARSIVSVRPHAASTRLGVRLQTWWGAASQPQTRGTVRRAVLETAYQERSYYLAYLKVSPTADPLRADPRFDDLLRRIGLAR